ncbi:hypothetical protein [Streptomyces sp. NPDC001492]
MRERTRLLIDAQPDMEVVAEASTGRKAAELAEVVVMDIRMLEVDGTRPPG